MKRSDAVKYVHKLVNHYIIKPDNEIDEAQADEILEGLEHLLLNPKGWIKTHEILDDDGKIQYIDVHYDGWEPENEEEIK